MLSTWRDRFFRWCEKNYSALVRFARRLARRSSGSHDRADLQPEKIVNQVVARIATRERPLKSPEFLPYVKVSIRNEIHDCHRRAGCRQKHHAAFARSRANHVPEETYCEDAEFVATVSREIDQLSRRERYVVEHAFVENHTVRRIAKDLGCSAATVTRLKHKARNRLQALLKDGNRIPMMAEAG